MILNVQNLSVTFHSKSTDVHALKNVNLSLEQGKILAVVGESGSGKSTLAQALVGLVQWDSGGKYNLLGREVNPYKRGDFTFARNKIQMVFQDPYSSLNPRLNVFEIISAPLFARRIPKEQINLKIKKTLDLVGISHTSLNKYPHAFSGGQRQRIGLARALAVEPSILLCDEITSALDVSVQAQILHLLNDLRKELGLSLLFISHDLSVVGTISDEVLVLKNGNIQEYGATQKVFNSPESDYTKMLLESIPEFIAR